MDESRATLAALEGYGIVPVIRLRTPERARTAVEWLVDAGFQTVEVTMSVPGSVDVIKQFSGREDVLVGAGTVLDVSQAELTIRAGARYVVAPCFVDGLPDVCREAGVACILGGFTPNEVYGAWRSGADAVKVFPAATGGVEHVKALKSVFPDIPLVPTGGIDLDNVLEYKRSGAAFVGVGSQLVNPALIERGEREAFIDRGRAFLQRLYAAKDGGLS